MPLTQNAPLECGCCGFGATLVTRPSATVTSEPQHTEHSQQVLGNTPSVVGRFVSIYLCPATSSNVILRSAPKARVSKDGSKYRVCLHPSRRPLANASGLL